MWPIGGARNTDERKKGPKSAKSVGWNQVHEVDCIMPAKDKVLKEFEFIDGERKFFCSVEAPGKSGMPLWWWFRLDNGTSTRYAPFEASANDTKQSVQARIVAYYAELLAIEARPPLQRPVWRKPERPTPPGGAIPATLPLKTSV